MIPTFTPSGVIPPFANTPAIPGGSPYVTDLCTVVSTLGTTVERRGLISGLLDYREALRAIGVTSGFQLLDGSFTEECEKLRGRPPSDIDLVTYAYLPVSPREVQQFATDHGHLFNTPTVKQNYRCDAYFVDLAKDARMLVEETFYWYGLFSHQKTTYTWKGVINIPLMADDTAARNLLTTMSGAQNGP